MRSRTSQNRLRAIGMRVRIGSADGEALWSALLDDSDRRPLVGCAMRWRVDEAPPERVFTRAPNENVAGSCSAAARSSERPFDTACRAA